MNLILPLNYILHQNNKNLNHMDSNALKKDHIESV